MSWFESLLLGLVHRRYRTQRYVWGQLWPNTGPLEPAAEWKSGLGYTYNNPTLTRNQDFSDASWLKTNCTVTNGLLVATTTGARVQQAATNIDTNREYVVSFVATAGSGDVVYVGDSTVSNGYTWFSLASGTIGTEGAGTVASQIEDLGGGQYRCSVKLAAAASNTATLGVADADGSTSVTSGKSVSLASATVENGKLQSWADQRSGYVLQQTTPANQPWVDPFGGPGMQGNLCLSADFGA